MTVECDKLVVMEKFRTLMRCALEGKVAFADRPTDAEWREMYAISLKQSVAGVAFCAVQGLPKEMMPPKGLLLEWYAVSMRIRKRNEALYEKSVSAEAGLARMGYRACVLKGQGNAVMYPDAYSRTPGDIDVWVDGDRDRIVADVRKIFPNVEVSWQHVLFPVFKGVELEVHFFPSFMLNWFANRRLQRFFRRESVACFGNKVELPDGYGAVSVPSPHFNAVYQLTHIFRHYLTQGIGLRQFIDYYYVLRSLAPDKKEYVVEMFKKIGVFRFAMAVMYVEHHFLGLDREHLVVGMDERRGKALLGEIMNGGNFGKYEEKSWLNSRSFARRQMLKFCRNLRFLLSYPMEEMSEPFFRVYYFFWRRKYGCSSSSMH